VIEDIEMGTVEWRESDELVAYEDAVAAMEERVAAIREGRASELVWLLEHPPLYTAGSSAQPGDLLDPGRLPVYQTGRGGQYTYHGPGQRVAYVMLDLRARGPDVRAFVGDLEAWLIDTLAAFNLRGERREGRVGIWIDQGGGREAKIAALGVRIRRWVTYHGVALNVRRGRHRHHGRGRRGAQGELRARVRPVMRRDARTSDRPSLRQY
jgi:lipoyl(octanoyl) transferase